MRMLSGSSGLGRKPAFASSVLLVTLFVACFYGVFTIVALGIHNWDPLWFVWIGERYADLEPNGRIGYDGQFVYYIACSGIDAIPHLDNPSYRLQRILLPTAVRLLSLGIPSLVPWMVIVTNLGSIIAATHLVATWLSTQGLSPWYALIYSLYTGTLMAYSRDLTEPLAFGLAAWGGTLWLREKYAGAVLALALAALTKETTLLFVFGIACATLAQKRVKLTIAVLGAILPLAIWEGYLYARLGSIPLGAGPGPEWIPLRGIIPHLKLEPGRMSALLLAGLPAVVLLLVSVPFVLRQRRQQPAPWWLLLHSGFVVLLPFNVYDHIMHVGRNTMGLVLAVVFVLPLFTEPVRLLLVSYWVLPVFVWMIPVLRWAPWLSNG
jgi:hypothetical protein